MLARNTVYAVYNSGTRTAAALYTDASMGTSAGSSVPSDAGGLVVTYAQPGLYDLVPEQGGANVAPVTVQVPVSPLDTGGAQGATGPSGATGPAGATGAPGAGALTVTSENGPFTAADGHLYLVDATSAPVPVTVPHTPSGLHALVIKIDSSANAVTVAPDSGNLEAGGGAYASITLNKQGAVMEVVADGTNVQVVSPVMYGGDVAFRNVTTANPSTMIVGDDFFHSGDALGCKGGNAALASLLTALATIGLVTDSST